MSEWREARLGEVCSRLRSGTNITAKDIHEVGEVPVFGGNGIRGYASEPNFSGECAIIGRQGAYCGNVRYFNGAARMSEHAVVAVADAGNNTRFLAYLLSTMNLGRLSGQAAQPGLSVKILAQEPVLMPPLDLQARVASFVGSIDDLIENNRRRIEVLEEMARSIYREWFVKFRYPGHGDVPMVESALGPIPEGWGVTSLSAIADITTGQSPKSEFYNDAGIGKPFHQGVADFGSHFPSTRKWCSVEGRSAFDGDILVSVRAPVGRINIANTDITIGRGLAGLRAKDGRQGLLLGHLREAFAEEDSMGNDGAIFKSLSKTELSSVAVLVPPSDFADAANEILTDNLTMIRGLAQTTRQLSDIRDLLLPKLITGQIDVSSLDLDSLISEKVA